MARLRYNGLVAELAGSGLTNSATAITFAAALTHSGGTNVPTIVAPDYIPLTLLDSDGVPVEIVYLTAYTAAATTGTISRGRESTTGVSHSAGAAIIHSPTVQDIGPRGCIAVRTTTQSLATGDDDPVAFNAADEYDTDSIHDTSTNNSRFTVPAGMDGLWRFIGTVAYAANATGDRYVGWYKNGTLLSSYFGYQVARASSAIRTVQTSTLEINLVAGDYIEVAAFQNSGGSLNIDFARCVVTYVG